MGFFRHMWEMFSFYVLRKENRHYIREALEQMRKIAEEEREKSKK